MLVKINSFLLIKAVAAKYIALQVKQPRGWGQPVAPGGSSTPGMLPCQVSLCLLLHLPKELAENRDWQRFCTMPHALPSLRRFICHHSQREAETPAESETDPSFISVAHGGTMDLKSPHCLHAIPTLKAVHPKLAEKGFKAKAPS